MRVVFWGTYDLGKPRTRILLRGLRAAGVEVIEVHREVWRGVADKSRLGTGGRLAAALRWLAAYPGLKLRYLLSPRHDAVVVGYLGHLDVMVIAGLAPLRGVPVVWDAFLSLYDTVVEDRRLVARRGIAARALRWWEGRACRMAHRVVVDTEAHARWFEETYRLPPGRMVAVPVGAEPEAFPPRPAAGGGSAAGGGERPLRVLFYGQLIPLHGIETVLEAAWALRREPVDWLLVGSGQEEGRLRRFLAGRPAARVCWVPWVPYRGLASLLHRADVALGIFGRSGKASRVVPNKVYQAIAAGVPLVTRDSPAMRELVGEGVEGITLVLPGDPQALAATLGGLSAERSAWAGRELYTDLRARITPLAVGEALAAVVAEAVEAHR